ncbi:unnamed protein product, partial [Ilex paraguariensis]
MAVHDKDKEIPTCAEDEDYYEDIRGVYGQLFVQFFKQLGKVLYFSDQVNSSEEETRGLQEDSFKSKGQIRSLEDENKFLPDRMRFLLLREWQELVKSKKNLESKWVKFDKDLRESSELSNRHSQPSETFGRMFSMVICLGDNCGLGNTNERTHTSSMAVFVKCISNPSPRQ